MTENTLEIGQLVALCELEVSQSVGLLNSARHPRNHFLKVEEDLSNYFPPLTRLFGKKCKLGFAHAEIMALT